MTGFCKADSCSPATPPGISAILCTPLVVPPNPQTPLSKRYPWHAKLVLHARKCCLQPSSPSFFHLTPTHLEGPATTSLPLGRRPKPPVWIRPPPPTSSSSLCFPDLIPQLQGMTGLLHRTSDFMIVFLYKVLSALHKAGEQMRGYLLSVLCEIMISLWGERTVPCLVSGNQRKYQ